MGWVKEQDKSLVAKWVELLDGDPSDTDKPTHTDPVLGAAADLILWKLKKCKRNEKQNEKEVRLEWIKTSKKEDDILSVVSPYPWKELAQLRKAADHQGSWHFRPVYHSDKCLDEFFGENWYFETMHGFDSVADFRKWLRSKECL